MSNFEEESTNSIKKLDLNVSDARKLVNFASRNVIFFGDNNMAVCLGKLRLRIFHMSPPSTPGYPIRSYYIRIKGFNRCTKIKSHWGASDNTSLIKLNKTTFLWTNISPTGGVVRGFNIWDFRNNFKNEKAMAVAKFIRNDLSMMKLVRISDDLFCCFGCSYNSEFRKYRFGNRDRGVGLRGGLGGRNLSRGFYFQNQFFYLISYTKSKILKNIPYQKVVHKDAIAKTSRKYENSLIFYSGGLRGRRILILYNVVENEVIKSFLVRSMDIFAFDSFINFFHDEVIVFLDVNDDLIHVWNEKSNVPVTVKISRSGFFGSLIKHDSFLSISLLHNKIGFLGTDKGKIIYFLLQDLQGDENGRIEKNKKEEKSIIIEDFGITENIVRGTRSKRGGYFDVNMVKFLKWEIDESQNLVLVSIVNHDVVKVFRVDNLPLGCKNVVENELYSQDFEERISFLHSDIFCDEDTCITIQMFNTTIDCNRSLLML